jgi:hypothetical protein
MSDEQAMGDEQLAVEVRRLRAEGRSPKGIARALGVRPAAVAPLVRAIASQRAAAKAEDELVGCWVSPDWREGLTVSGHPEWSGGETTAAPVASGLVAVLLAREGRNRKVSVCGYLLDVWCLGVKNAVGPERMNFGELTAFRRTYFSPWNSSGVEAPIELARELVLGAAEYARTLGFAPHADFEPAREHLGPWTGPASIGFGRDGRPFYADGPYDDPAQVLRTLEGSVGSGNFHFEVSVGPHSGFSIA